jgi:metallo-beta-lactamase family protein
LRKNYCSEEPEKIEGSLCCGSNMLWISKFPIILTAKLINVGHVPGSVCFIFTIDNKKVLFSEDLRSGYSRFNGEFDIPEKIDLIATYVEYRHKAGMEQCKFFRNDSKKALGAEKMSGYPLYLLTEHRKFIWARTQDGGIMLKKIPICSISLFANVVTTLYQREAAKERRNPKN